MSTPIYLSFLFLSPFLISIVHGQSATYTPSSGVLNVQEFENWVQSNYAKYPTLILAPGTYQVTPLSGSNHHLGFTNLVNGVLIMNGVTLILTARSTQALYFGKCANYTFAGVTIRYQTVPTNVAHIVSIGSDGKSYHIQIPTGYPTDDFRTGTPTCNVFDSKTRWWKAGTWDLYPSSYVQINSTDFTMNFNNDLGPNAQNVAPGDLLGCRQNGFAFVVQLDNCDHVTLEDITLQGGPGFGFFESGSPGGNILLRCSIRRPPAPSGASEAPLLSTSADGFHSAGSRKGPTVDSCYFEGMPDDGVAIHGSYSVITQAQSNQVWVTSNTFAVGDRVLIYDNEFRPVGSFISITNVATASGYKPPQNASKTIPNINLNTATYQILTLGTTVPSGTTFDYILSNSDLTGSNFLIRNTTIYNHRARGFLIKAREGFIIGNRVDGSTMGGIIITPELYWAEADYSQNLVVCGNTINNIGYSKQAFGGIVLGSYNPQNQFTAGYGHINVNITNNLFSNMNYNNFWLSSAKNVNFINNVIQNPLTSASWTGSGTVPNNVAVYMSQGQNIAVNNNCIVNAGSYLSAPIQVTSTVTGPDDFQKGVSTSCTTLPPTTPNNCPQWGVKKFN